MMRMMFVGLANLRGEGCGGSCQHHLFLLLVALLLVLAAAVAVRWR